MGFPRAAARTDGPVLIMMMFVNCIASAVAGDRSARSKIAFSASGALGTVL